MGLDGISLNQLRSPIEQPIREYNSQVSASSSSDSRVVGAMSNSGRVDPDKESSKNTQDFDFGQNENKKQDENEEEVVKYDLSDNEKYSLNIDEDNMVSIVEKSTGNVIQKLNSQELSRYVSFLSNSNGSIVNRRF